MVVCHGGYFCEITLPLARKNALLAVAKMRVVSLVPSLTETLIDCGVNVVGRTRFCVHPRDKIQLIKAVGGTKDLDLDQLRELQPDFLIVDKEENLPWMKEKAPCQVLVTHVEDLQSLVRELSELGNKLHNQNLIKLSQHTLNLLNRTPLDWDWKQIPGATKWVQNRQRIYKKFIYLIWKDPWMSVSKQTFIGSIFKQLGGESFFYDFEDKYPKLNLSAYPESETLLLCSSEPYPFAKKEELLRELDFDSVLIDGESYSWFGIRSIRFLEQCYQLNKEQQFVPDKF